MGLSEFPVILLPVILHFSGDIGNGTLCVKVPLIRCSCCFPLLPLLILRILIHGFVTVGLLDNFLNFLTLFLAVVSDFTKSL